MTAADAKKLCPKAKCAPRPRARAGASLKLGPVRARHFAQLLSTAGTALAALPSVQQPASARGKQQDKQETGFAPWRA